MTPVTPQSPPRVSVAVRRCTRHQEREAAARCRDCAHYFCRECVTDHDNVVLCASCLSKRAQAKTKSKEGVLSRLRRPALIAAGCLLTWLLWYQFGRLLLSIPQDVHNGILWQPTHHR